MHSMDMDYCCTYLDDYRLIDEIRSLIWVKKKETKMTPKKIARMITGKRTLSNRNHGGGEAEDDREGGSTSSSSNVREEDFVIERPTERLKSSRGSRLNLLTNELGFESNGRKFSSENLLDGLKDLTNGLVIHPENRYVICRTLPLRFFSPLHLLIFFLILF